MQHLRSNGFDITSISEVAAGIDDTKVMNIAIKDESTIITYDSDYGELIFKYGHKPEAGVIYIRIQPKHPLHCAEIIATLTVFWPLN